MKTYLIRMIDDTTFEYECEGELAEAIKSINEAGAFIKVNDWKANEYYINVLEIKWISNKRDN